MNLDDERSYSRGSFHIYTKQAEERRNSCLSTISMCIYIYLDVNLVFLNIFGKEKYRATGPARVTVKLDRD